jgi:hypothetical protein
MLKPRKEFKLEFYRKPTKKRFKTKVRLVRREKTVYHKPKGAFHKVRHLLKHRLIGDVPLVVNLVDIEMNSMSTLDGYAVAPPFHGGDSRF